MKGRTAEDKFKNGYNCSQAVFCSFCDEFDCDEKTALSIATGFGGGFGRQGMMCGCLSGAAMVIGMKYGNESKGNPEVRNRTYDKIKEFSRKFEQKFGEMNCADLIKLRLDNPDDRQIAADKNIFAIKCSAIVRETAAMLQEYVAMPK